ncbi:MAG TPA: hypothetical protein VFN95_13130, partial [Flavitalea sp.]|nr:hypothetical protein [Flavitalea sp.]
YLCECSFWGRPELVEGHCLHTWNDERSKSSQVHKFTRSQVGAFRGDHAALCYKVPWCLRPLIGSLAG